MGFYSAKFISRKDMTEASSKMPPTAQADKILLFAEHVITVMQMLTTETQQRNSAYNSAWELYLGKACDGFIKIEWKGHTSTSFYKAQHLKRRQILCLLITIPI